MAGFGTTAILIVLAIAVFVAVPGMLASRGRTLGRMFRDFRKTPSVPEPSLATAPVARSRFCTECGSLGASGAFCTQCGARL